MSSPRVIAGRYGGRVLKVPRGMTTRPTGARVREALFNVLGDIAGASVLDLYAGSGALSLEAISRGAVRAVLVEADRAALDALRDNVATLGVVDSVRVLPLRLPRAIASAAAHGPFDLVFCDPPWAELEEACAALTALVSAACLAPDARIALEHSVKDREPLVPGLLPNDRRAWGDTAVSLFRAPPTI